MLRRLEIENYGLIARAGVDFSPGATIFTGETGSGKTMLLGALSFALGARAGSDALRRGARKGSVTLIFDPDDELRERLHADGFEIDPGEDATLVREMNDAGRSAMRVNGRPSTAAYVRDVADAIAEIVGQHEAQRLLSPAYHLELLDRFAGEAGLRARAAVAWVHAQCAELAEELAALTASDSRAREQYEDALFAVREIEEAHLEPGEERRLRERRGYLDNAERIALALRTSSVALAGDEGGAIAALGDAVAALGSICGIDAELARMAQSASVLQSEVNDLATGVSRALEATEFDPDELEAINARLETFDRLERKYGGSVEQVLRRADEGRRTIEAYEGRDRRIAEHAARAAAAARELDAAAKTLTALRAKAAGALARRVGGEFGDIALQSGRFEVALEPLERVGAKGAERAAFRFAATNAQPARPLAQIASGGELSRVLLALVVVLSGARNASSALVFDEIDAGIGGATAAAVGARIGRLARAGQVVCVTHLAQLATCADRHYVLEKSEDRSGTAISVREIASARERETEIARMLSGESHETALRHARALLAKPLST